MNKGLISGLVLLCLGVVCGVLLATVNHFTAGIIHENAIKEKREMLRQFYPDIDSYDLDEIELEGDINSLYLLKDKTTHDVYAAIYGVSAIAYKGRVNMLIAIDADFTVRDYAFVGNSGTEGLGLTLADLDFGMTGVLISDWATEFDALSGVTVTSIGYGPAYDGGVRRCFELVAGRVVADFGGGN
ncbi:MAG: FMN-binding protein [Candidatus Izemoplasmatales bacterium]|jgi:Na+-translocating ferredoxin:NAD+ oxidoreductase RnfG subunit